VVSSGSSFKLTSLCLVCRTGALPTCFVPSLRASSAIPRYFHSSFGFGGSKTSIISTAVFTKSCGFLVKASSMRLFVPKRFVTTGNFDPLTRVKSSALPCRSITRR
jgi:hypothetical protein